MVGSFHYLAYFSTGVEKMLVPMLDIGTEPQRASMDKKYGKWFHYHNVVPVRVPILHDETYELLVGMVTVNGQPLEGLDWENLDDRVIEMFRLLRQCGTCDACKDIRGMLMHEYKEGTLDRITLDSAKKAFPGCCCS